MRSTLHLALALVAAGALSAQPTPTDLPGLSYDVEFFPGAKYDSSIPTTLELIGIRPGDRAAFPAEIATCLEAWDAASPRTRLVEYARSHEGRALYYMIITSAANMERLDEIQRGLERLADPRGLDEAEAERLLATLPATAWLAYSIHGDETSGADGALAVIHHLTAATNPEVTRLLDDLVILVDPMMNPDGRHRFLTQIAEHRATAPNVDDQSLLHAGYWPWGRGNHYLFDLNRDWMPAVNPETRGRIREVAAWNPLLFVDAHEMGALDSYLFAPAREPKNPHVPGRRQHWGSVFARQQSEAFDRYNWLYYTGEWNEGWYPGYSDAWAEYRGAVGILYEQSGYAEDAVRMPAGQLATYREAVHHQAVSSLANLDTLHANRSQMLREFYQERLQSVSADGPYAGRTFAILPTSNRSRLDGFLEWLLLHGIEVYEAPQPIANLSGTDRLGRAFSHRTLPAGTLLVPNRQPEAPLVATFFEFDTRMGEDYLRRERKSILETGGSSIYDVTAWSATMLQDLEALTIEGGLPANAVRVERAADRAAASAAALAPVESGPIVAWVIDGADDNSVVAAARLMEQGLRVRVADRPFELGSATFVRGSVVVLPADNRTLEGDPVALLEAAGEALGLAITSVSTGLGEGDLPDLGGGHFTLLERPRIALAARGGVSTTDYGSIWHTLDHRLGIRHSQLETAYFNFADLRRYNVLILPSGGFGPSLPEGSTTALGSWVRAGGTLIATGGSAGWLASEDSEISNVRELGDVLDKLDDYELAVLRELQAGRSQIPSLESIWAHAAADSAEYPWSAHTAERPSASELERRDRWQRMFMPRGAFLAARVNPEHWLTLGAGDYLSVLYGTSRVLMADETVEAPIRLGVLSPRSGAQARRVGWGPVPEGHDLHLRMSGLVWPEAVERLANAAVVTRESKGNGQVILFAISPTFRAATPGMIRIFLNAVVYGPGFGASTPIEP